MINDCCKPQFYITGATVSSNVVTLTLGGSPAVSNGLIYTIGFAPNVPVPAGVLGTDTVQISINGTTYALWDSFGVPLTFSELPTAVCRCSNASVFYPRKLRVGVGTVSGTSHFTVFNLPARCGYPM